MYLCSLFLWAVFGSTSRVNEKYHMNGDVNSTAVNSAFRKLN